LGALTSYVLRNGAKIVPWRACGRGGTLTFSPYKAVLHDLARLDTGKRLTVMRLLCLEALMPLLEPLQCQSCCSWFTSGDGFQYSEWGVVEVAENQGESWWYRLDRGGINGVGARTNQTGILGGSAGCLKRLTEMAEGYRMWLDRIAISYGA